MTDILGVPVSHLEPAAPSAVGETRHFHRRFLGPLMWGYLAIRALRDLT